MTGYETALRESLAASYRHLENLGLVDLASGNLSCRAGDDMLISPSGVSAASISPQNVVRTSMEGSWTGEYKPSSEWRMHTTIYQQTEAGAVVHTHSDYCVAVSCQRGALPGFHYLVGTFGGTDVPCVPYFTFGSPELAEAAAEALTERTACLLGSHGMICRGSDLGEAVSTAHQLEVLCRQYVLACQLGEPTLLSDQEWDSFFEQMRATGYGHMREDT